MIMMKEAGNWEDDCDEVRLVWRGMNLKGGGGLPARQQSLGIGTAAASITPWTR